MHGLFLPTNITKTYANGDVYQTILTYPPSYMACATLADALADNCGTPLPAMQNDAKAIWTMALTNRLTPIIEKRVLKNNQLCRYLTRYKDFGTKGIKPYQKSPSKPQARLHKLQ